MRFFFTNKKLQQLYETGNCKKYRLEKHIIMVFVWMVGIVQDAVDIHEFWNQPALGFEKLNGYNSRYSFRLSRKYRLEVEIEWINDEKTIGIIGIAEISNHYH